MEDLTSSRETLSVLLPCMLMLGFPRLYFLFQSPAQVFEVAEVMNTLYASDGLVWSGR